MSERKAIYGALELDHLVVELEGTGPLSAVLEPGSDTRIKGFKDLRVWQGGMKLVDLVYELSRKFPKEELYGLTSQVRRASISVPSNIAEGWGKNKSGYLLLGLSHARGSLHEVETHLLIAVRAGWLTKEEVGTTIDHINVLSAGLLNFMDKLEQKR